MENIMASSFPWLTLLVALPALGVLLLAVIPGLRKNAGKGFALAVSLLELASAIGAALSFDWTQSGSYQLLESHPWIAQMGVTWSLGVNALGLVMILLAVALVPLVLLAGWNEDENEAEAGAYASLVLFLEMFMVVIFAAFDLVVFYIAGATLPFMAVLGNWNFLIGLGLIAASFFIATFWK